MTFFEAGDEHGDGAWAMSLFFEGKDGARAGARIPGKGNAGDIFLQAQFPLHSGRILGLPGRIMISITGATGGDAFCHGSDSVAEETPGARKKMSAKRVSTTRDVVTGLNGITRG